MTAQRAPEAGGKAVSADAEFLELERQLVEARKLPAETDAEFDEHSNKVLGIERQIVTVRAEGPIGAAVKLRLANHILKQMHRDELHLPEIVGVQSALETIEHLAEAVGTAGDAELFELHNEWKRLEKAAEKTDHKADWQTAFAAEQRFLETPARTLEGVLFKLRLGCLPETYELEHLAEDGTAIAPPAVLAALADLERMAGGPA